MMRNTCQCRDCEIDATCHHCGERTRESHDPETGLCCRWDYTEREVIEALIRSDVDHSDEWTREAMFLMGVK
jgi:hypothetical protein